MAEIFNAIDRYAENTGAAFLAIHHQTKGLQSAKDVVDVGSGASSFARAVDAHLVMRPHEEDNHFVLDAAIRSFPPIEPLAMRWEYPLWYPADGVDPAELKGLKTRGEESQVKRDAEADASVLQCADGWTSHRKLKIATGFGDQRLYRCYHRLQARGMLEHQKQTIRGNEADCYRRSWRANFPETEDANDAS